jgi:hypothetical protein
MRKTSDGIAKKKVPRTSCWVVVLPASLYVKRKARVVIMGAAARMPPYFGFTCCARYVTPTMMPPRR